MFGHFKDVFQYIGTLLPCRRKRSRHTEPEVAAQTEPGLYRAKRVKPDPESEPKSLTDSGPELLIKSPIRKQRLENALITLETITLPSIRRQTIEDMISFNGQRATSTPFNVREDGFSHSGLVGCPTLSSDCDGRNCPPGPRLETQENEGKDTTRVLVFGGDKDQLGKTTVLTSKYYTNGELQSPGKLRNKVQELRAAATLGQAKLKFLGQCNNNKHFVGERLLEESKSESQPHTFTFQAENGKLIQTLYRKDIFAQFTTIFDHCEKLSLVPLPADILSQVSLALTQPSYKFKNTELKQRDFAKLSEGVWLNDEIINAYIELVRDREKTEGKLQGYPDTLVFNTFMYSLVHNDLSAGKYSFEKYKRTWERRLKADIASKEQIIFPINKQNVHWLLCLARINKFPEVGGKLEIYDSLPSGNPGFVEEVIRTVSVLLNDAFKLGVKGNWEYEMKECPRQRNCYDCGVCMCANVEALTRGKEPAYTSKDTGYFRKKIAVEILQGKLLPASQSRK